jgi:hypothetical protein
MTERIDDHIRERLRRATAPAMTQHELEIRQRWQRFGAAQRAQRARQTVFRQHGDGETGVERRENPRRTRALKHYGPLAAREIELVQGQLPPAAPGSIQREWDGHFRVELHACARRPDASFATQ